MSRDKRVQILDNDREEFNTGAFNKEGDAVPKSVLEAIKLGLWEFEPPEVDGDEFSATAAMPGTKDKLTVMAERLRSGLPLWHPLDRDDIEDPPPPPCQRPR